MQSTMLRSLPSSHLYTFLPRYYSSVKESTKQVANKTVSQVSSSASGAKEAVQDQISSRGPISSDKAYNSTSEATTRVSGIVKEFISPIPVSNLHFNTLTHLFGTFSRTSQLLASSSSSSTSP